MIKCWFDGACGPVNPGGHIGFGALIVADTWAWEHSGYVPLSETTTNNVAEYFGVISLLQELQRRGSNKEPIHVFGDSKLVIEQMSGCWKIRKGNYLKAALEAQKLLRDFEDIRFSWIPREENTLADELSKRELVKRGIQIDSREQKQPATIKPEPRVARLEW